MNKSYSIKLFSRLFRVNGHSLFFCRWSRGKTKAKALEAPLAFIRHWNLKIYTRDSVGWMFEESGFLSMFWDDKGFKADGYNGNIIKPFSDNGIIIFRSLRTAELELWAQFIHLYLWVLFYSKVSSGIIFTLIIFETLLQQNEWKRELSENILYVNYKTFKLSIFWAIIRVLEKGDLKIFVTKNILWFSSEWLELLP